MRCEDYGLQIRADTRSGVSESPNAHLRILVVEDDFGDYDAVARALKRMNVYTSEHLRAKTLVEARKALADQSFDVALVDFHLGSESGAQLLDELNTTDRSIVPILLTGRSETHVHQAALQAGAASCINKDDLSSTLLETTFRYTLHNDRQRQIMHQLVARLASQEGQRVD